MENLLLSRLLRPQVKTGNVLGNCTIERTTALRFNQNSSLLKNRLNNQPEKVLMKCCQKNLVLPTAE